MKILILTFGDLNALVANDLKFVEVISTVCFLIKFRVVHHWDGEGGATFFSLALPRSLNVSNVLWAAR